VRRDVVVIGASAGGLQALQQLMALLPADLPASVLVVTHLPPVSPSRLPDILAKSGRLPAAAAVDNEPLRRCHIHAAVPDQHLLIGEHDTVRLSSGPRQNRVRPAVDPLFRSAARWCGARVIGVVLSGTLDDGAAGLAAIAQSGGAALVQHPDEARFDGMPRAALAAVPGAVVGTAAHLARTITELAGRPVEATGDSASEDLIWETDMNDQGGSDARQAGRPVGLGCPECSGGMNVVENGNAVHYVCHTGHSYSPQTLVAARDEGIESALWTALSAMQEKSTVLQELATRVAADRPDDVRHYRDAADRVAHAADVLKTFILGEGATSTKVP
jgi:two-component system chemotaxis response regulator CheB